MDWPSKEKILETIVFLQKIFGFRWRFPPIHSHIIPLYIVDTYYILDYYINQHIGATRLLKLIIPYVLLKYWNYGYFSHIGLLYHIILYINIQYMGISINKSTPKWLVYNAKAYQNGWFRVPLFQETPKNIHYTSIYEGGFPEMGLPLVIIPFFKAPQLSFLGFSMVPIKNWGENPHFSWWNPIVLIPSMTRASAAPTLSAAPPQRAPRRSSRGAPGAWTKCRPWTMKNGELDPKNQDLKLI